MVQIEKNVQREQTVKEMFMCIAIFNLYRSVSLHSLLRSTNR